MAEPADDVYGRLWSPREYLRQYYAGAEISPDEVANARFLSEQFRRLNRRFATALEFGCGPTVHHAAVLAPHVDQLHLADYLPGNLAEVRQWLDADRQAHDWSVYFSGMLAAIGENPRDVAARQTLLRSKVTELLPGDIRSPHPLGSARQYDLVASYYCGEAVAVNRTEWGEYLANLCGLVAPGGVLLVSAVRRCRQYRLFDHLFSTAHIDESDFAEELPKLGFPAAETCIRPFEGAGWGNEGFDSICCVCAVKSPGTA